MTKFFEYLDKNALKIVLTATLILGVFLGCLYVSTIKSEVCNLGKNLKDVATTQAYVIDQLRDSQDKADATTIVTFKALSIIIDQLVDIAKTQQYIIDQLRDKEPSSSKVFKNSGKPTYEELKSRTVYVIGCSNKELPEATKTQYLLGEEEGMCWSGTASIIKITDTETYILSNSHVFGKGQDNVHIYIENGIENVEAQIVAYNKYEDIAVAKISGKLIGKTSMNKISTVHIQDPVYVVGHPLRVKYTYSEGILAGYEDTSLLFQLPCIYGSSGSAIWDSKGNLVGVVYALEMYSGFMGIPEARITHTLAVDSLVVKHFLEDLGLYND
jgi:S1-C subfamily serine protease